MVTVCYSTEIVFSANVLGMMNVIPYNAHGLLDICAAQKQFEIKNRIIMFYKYDSHVVDCVKLFTSSNRNIKFRFLLVKKRKFPVPFLQYCPLVSVKKVNYSCSVRDAEYFV